MTVSQHRLGGLAKPRQRTRRSNAKSCWGKGKLGDPPKARARDLGKAKQSGLVRALVPWQGASAPCGQVILLSAMLLARHSKRVKAVGNCPWRHHLRCHEEWAWLTLLSRPPWGLSWDLTPRPRPTMDLSVCTPVHAGTMVGRGPSHLFLGKPLARPLERHCPSRQPALEFFMSQWQPDSGMFHSPNHAIEGFFLCKQNSPSSNYIFYNMRYSIFI